MSDTKKPGVYVVENNTPVPELTIPQTMPLFLGYTKLTGEKGSLIHKIQEISSIDDYQKLFGTAALAYFDIIETDEATGVKLYDKYYTVKKDSPFTLHQHIEMFFANGGSSCYVMSVGNFTGGISAQHFQAGLDAIPENLAFDLLVLPEIVNLPTPDGCYMLQNRILRFCEIWKSFSILDIYDGYKPYKEAEINMINAFSLSIGAHSLEHGTTYYPWIYADLYKKEAFNLSVITNKEVLKELISDELDANIDAILGEDITVAADPAHTAELHKILMDVSPFYRSIFDLVYYEANKMPVSSTMAGIYCAQDKNRGTWKAPANIAIAKTTGLCVTIDVDMQEELNSGAYGVNINCIRAFPEQGILVWGARLLKPASEHKYVNTFRTLLMIENVIRRDIQSAFTGDLQLDFNVSVKYAIENFLRNLWKNGALMGSTPVDAYSIAVDYLWEYDTTERYNFLNINLQLALVKPAEFSSLHLRIEKIIPETLSEEKEEEPVQTQKEEADEKKTEDNAIKEEEQKTNNNNLVTKEQEVKQQEAKSFFSLASDFFAKLLGIKK